MSIIHLMVGVQGSGKSTFSKKLSKKLNIKIVSTDIVRQTNPGIDESLVWPMVYQSCASELINGNDVIFDATNITPKVRQRLKDNIDKFVTDYEVGCYYFKVDLKTCIERVANRNQNPDELFLPIEAVSSYFEKIIPPTLEEGFCFVKVVDEFGEILEEKYK